MACRILGMGDVLTLIEKAQETSFDAERGRSGSGCAPRPSIDDYLRQMQQIKKMGRFPAF